MDLSAGNSFLSLTIEGSAEELEVFRAEGGGHRVQRVPPNEKRGRVHSSTVTVAVLGDVHIDPQYLKRRPEDFAVSFFSGTGPGGQNRNKVQASARIVHIPTGLVRTAQTRSRENSVRLAMEALSKDLDAAQTQSQWDHTNTVRTAQTGSGMRGDKRRTYRSQEDTVNDHENGKRARMSDVMKGKFDALWW